MREPFARLLVEAGEAVGVRVLTIDDTRRDVLGVRPDYVVNVTDARVGYFGLKARGRKVPATWTPTTRESRRAVALSFRVASLDVIQHQTAPSALKAAILGSP